MCLTGTVWPEPRWGRRSPFPPDYHGPLGRWASYECRHRVNIAASSTVNVPQLGQPGAPAPLSMGHRFLLPFSGSSSVILTWAARGPAGFHQGGPAQ